MNVTLLRKLVIDYRDRLTTREQRISTLRADGLPTYSEEHQSIIANMIRSFDGALLQENTILVRLLIVVAELRFKNALEAAARHDVAGSALYEELAHNSLMMIRTCADEDEEDPEHA